MYISKKGHKNADPTPLKRPGEVHPAKHTCLEGPKRSAGCLSRRYRIPVGLETPSLAAQMPLLSRIPANRKDKTPQAPGGCRYTLEYMKYESHPNNAEAPPKGCSSPYAYLPSGCCNIVAVRLLCAISRRAHGPGRALTLLRRGSLGEHP